MAFEEPSFFQRLFEGRAKREERLANLRKDAIEGYEALVDEKIKAAIAETIADHEERARKAAAEIEEAEETRIRNLMESDEPWHEVIDYRQDLGSVTNYRFNRAFITAIKRDHGIIGKNNYDVFNKYLTLMEEHKRLDLLKEEKQKHLDSPDPWFNWEQKNVSDEGYSLQLEWNDAHIAHLRQLGYAGKDEEEIVRLWLSQMVRAAFTNMDFDSGE